MKKLGVGCAAGCAVLVLALLGLSWLGSRSLTQERIKQAERGAAAAKAERERLAKLSPEERAAEEAARKKRAEEQRRRAEEAEARKPNAERDLSLECPWSKGGFGSVALVDLRITNKSKVLSYKDVVVAFTFAGESGTQVARREEVFTVAVAPGRRKAFQEYNVGLVPQQATRMGCAVIRAEAF